MQSFNTFDLCLVIYVIAVVYWLASLVVLGWRLLVKEFRNLTQYGARAGTIRAGTPSSAQQREVAGRRGGIGSMLARVIGVAGLGRVRVSRRSGFVSFYFTGLAACAVVYILMSGSPCIEVAARGAYAHLLNDSTIDPSTLVDTTLRPSPAEVRRLGRIPKSQKLGQQQGEDARSAERWKAFLQQNPRVRNGPFAHLRNETIALQATAVYEEDLAACRAYTAPLSLLEWLPLGLFAVHCLIRLLECCAVHQYRGDAEDTMTLFAAIAGCSFYVIAAPSCSLLLFRAYRSAFMTASFTSAGLIGSLQDTDSARTLTSLSQRFSQLMQMRRTPQEHMLATREEGRRHFLWTIAGQIADLSLYHAPRAIVFTLAALHLMLQIIQMVHHEALAKLRRVPLTQMTSRRATEVLAQLGHRIAPYVGVSERVASAKDLNDTKLLQASPATDAPATVRKRRAAEEGATTYAAPTQSSMLADPRVWEYHYPYTLLFQLVLEPHYTCEVLMYVVNAALVGTLLLYGCGIPTALNRVAPFVPLVVTESSSLWLVVVLQVFSAAGVLTFTVANLGITAHEHRCFWEYVNEVREVLLLMDRSSAGTTPLPPPSTQGEGEGEARRHMTEEKGWQYQRDLHRLLRAELLPRWNLFPEIW